MYNEALCRTFSEIRASWSRKEASPLCIAVILRWKRFADFDIRKVRGVRSLIENCNSTYFAAYSDYGRKIISEFHVYL